jgi:hypothetical protein
MSPLLVAAVILMESPAIGFERHEIDKFPAGYQVAVADINGDGRPDVIALSTEANRVDWYENPTWKRRADPVAQAAGPHPRPLSRKRALVSTHLGGLCKYMGCKGLHFRRWSGDYRGVP